MKLSIYSKKCEGKLFDVQPTETIEQLLMTVLPSFTLGEGDYENAALTNGEDWMPYESTIESLGLQENQSILLYLPSEYTDEDASSETDENTTNQNVDYDAPIEYEEGVEVPIHTISISEESSDDDDDDDDDDEENSQDKNDSNTVFITKQDESSIPTNSSEQIQDTIPNEYEEESTTNDTYIEETEEQKEYYHSISIEQLCKLLETSTDMNISCYISEALCYYYDTNHNSLLEISHNYGINHLLEHINSFNSPVYIRNVFYILSTCSQFPNLILSIVSCNGIESIYKYIHIYSDNHDLCLYALSTLASIAEADQGKYNKRIIQGGMSNILSLMEHHQDFADITLVCVHLISILSLTATSRSQIIQSKGIDMLYHSINTFIDNPDIILECAKALHILGRTEPSILYQTNVLHYISRIYSSELYNNNYKVLYELLAVITNVMQLDDVDMKALSELNILSYIVKNERFFTNQEYAKAYSAFVRNISTNSDICYELINLQVLSQSKTLISMYKTNPQILNYILSGILNLSACSNVEYQVTKSGIYDDITNLLNIFGKRTDKSYEDILILLLKIVYNAIIHPRNLPLMGSPCLTAVKEIDLAYKNHKTISPLTQNIIQLFSDYLSRGYRLGSRPNVASPEGTTNVLAAQAKQLKPMGVVTEKPLLPLPSIKEKVSIDEDMNTKPQLPSLPTAKPALPSLPTAKPALPALPSAKPALPALPSAKPALPALPSAKPALPALPSAKPALPALPSAKPALPALPSAKPALPALPSAKPALPALPSAKPVPVPPSAKPTLPSKYQKPLPPVANKQTQTEGFLMTDADIKAVDKKMHSNKFFKLFKKKSESESYVPAEPVSVDESIFDSMNLCASTTPSLPQRPNKPSTPLKPNQAMEIDLITGQLAPISNQTISSSGNGDLMDLNDDPFFGLNSTTQGTLPQNINKPLPLPQKKKEDNNISFSNYYN